MLSRLEGCQASRLPEPGQGHLPEPVWLSTALRCSIALTQGRSLRRPRSGRPACHRPSWSPLLPKRTPTARASQLHRDRAHHVILARSLRLPDAHRLAALLTWRRRRSRQHRWPFRDRTEDGRQTRPHMAELRTFDCGSGRGTRAAWRLFLDLMSSSRDVLALSVLWLAHADQVTSPAVDRRSPGRVDRSREVIEKANEPL
jgi:hypothetical protein